MEKVVSVPFSTDTENSILSANRSINYYKTIHDCKKICRSLQLFTNNQQERD